MSGGPDDPLKTLELPLEVAAPARRDPPTAKTMPVNRSGRAIPKTVLPAPLGPYTLEKRLGVGGMAEVFLARRDGPAGFTKQIVLKRILPHLAEDPRFVEMFLREAQTAAGLNHTNVVQVHELGEVEQQYYIAMEYVDGITLYKLAKRAWRAGRSVPMEVVLRAIADGALGLHHAHSLKDAAGNTVSLVHRDISPDNLMINRDGVTKVLDFGIAKGANSSGVTKTGELKGKIPYMSPEQIQGHDLDGRSDLYSLGITMYWLLTGERPFSGATELMTLQGVLTEEARAPSEINAHIPPMVDDIVLALLEKDPALRPSTGAELHDLLLSLAPSRTSESSQFVVDMIETVEATLPAASAPASGGFVPSTPLTTKLGSAERRVIRKRPPPKRKLPMTAIAAGGAGALVIGALMLGLLIGGDKDPDDLPPPSDVVVKKVEDLKLEAPGEDTPAEPSVATKKESGEPAEAAPEAPVTPPPAVDEPKAAAAKSASRSRRARKRETRASAPAVPMMSVKTRGPGSLTWKFGAKKFGRGARTIEIPEGTRFVTAIDATTGGVHKVPVVRDTADFLLLKKGRMSLRIFPFARVTIGRKVIGTTPLSPIALVAGTYKVKLEHESKVVYSTVDVPAGGTAKLKVDMRK